MTGRREAHLKRRRFEACAPRNETRLRAELTWQHFPVAVLLVAVLAGCAGQRPSTPGSVTAAGPAATKASVAADRRRLAAALRGTPATVVARADGSLRVDVPLALSFDSGRSTVKSPLAGVLDRLVLSERSAPTRFLITAPTDPASRGLLLGTDRAVNARTHMEERGVSPARFSVSAIARGQYVEIVVART